METRSRNSLLIQSAIGHIRVLPIRFQSAPTKTSIKQETHDSSTARPPTHIQTSNPAPILPLQNTFPIPPPLTASQQSAPQLPQPKLLHGPRPWPSARLPPCSKPTSSHSTLPHWLRYWLHRKRRLRNRLRCHPRLRLWLYRMRRLGRRWSRSWSRLDGAGCLGRVR